MGGNFSHSNNNNLEQSIDDFLDTVNEISSFEEDFISQQVNNILKVSVTNKFHDLNSQMTESELEVLQSLGRNSGIEALQLVHLTRYVSQFAPRYWVLQKKRSLLYSKVVFHMETLRKRPPKLFEFCQQTTEGQLGSTIVLTTAPKMFVCARSSIKLILLYFKSLSVTDIPEASEFLDEFVANLSRLPLGALRRDRQEVHEEFWTYGLDQLRDTLAKVCFSRGWKTNAERKFMRQLLEGLLTLAIARQSLYDILVVCECLLLAGKLEVSVNEHMEALVGYCSFLL